MRVLVTGCGGFLGREIVHQLLARGDTVVGVSRRRYADLEMAGIEHRQGDLTNREFCRSSICDVDGVIHTAAVAGIWGPWSHFHSINYLATVNVVDACREASIRKLIYTSSPSVTFDGEHQRNVDESVPYPTKWLCHYPQTKAMAEKWVLQSNESGILYTVALRPHLIWGNDDPHLIPRIIAKAQSGRLRIVGDGENMVDTVHVTNAAAAHLDALDADPVIAGGRAYFIAQEEPVNCWQWIGQICELAGVKPPTKRISFQAAYLLGATFETVYRLTGRQSEPPMTRFVSSQLAKDHFFDISSAKERLGYRVRITMQQGFDRLGAAKQ